MTRMHRIHNRLCGSSDEFQFVETLLSLAIYKIQERGEETIRATHDQIRQIAALRFGEALRGWDDRQLARLKLKYITRPGVPARVFELIREIAKGHKVRNGNPGSPSEYEATGIRAFLKPQSGTRTMVSNREEDRKVG